MVDPPLPMALKHHDLGAIISALYNICMPSISGISHATEFVHVMMTTWNPAKTPMYAYIDQLDQQYDRVMALSDTPPTWDELKVSQLLMNLSRDPNLHQFTQPMLTSGDIPKTPAAFKLRLIEYITASNLIESYGASGGARKARDGAQQSSTFAVQSHEKKDQKKKTCHFCHKSGHVQADCYAYRDAAALAQKPKSNRSAKTHSDSSVSSVSTTGSSKTGKKHSHKGKKGGKSGGKKKSSKDKKVSFVNMVSTDDRSISSSSSSDSCVFYNAARVDAYYDPDLPPDALIYVDSCASEHTLCPKAAPKINGGTIIDFAANERLHLSTGNGSIRPTQYVSVPKMGDCIILPRMKTNLYSFPRALATGFYWELERIGPGYVAYDLYRSDDDCFIARFDQTPYGWATELSKLVSSLQSPTGGKHPAASVFNASVTGNKRPHPGPSNVELKRAQEVLLLHQSMNCTSLRTLKVMLQSGTIIDTHLTARDVDVCVRHLPACPICLAVKSRAAPRPTSTKEPVRCIGERVHCDLFFIFKSIFLLFVDGFTNFAGGIVLRSKATSQIRRGLTTVSNFFSQMGNPVGVFSWDREPGAVALASLHEFPCVFSAAEGHELTCERFAQTTRLAAYACYKRQPFRVPPSLCRDLVLDVLRKLNDAPNSKTAPQTPNMVCLGIRASAKDLVRTSFGTMAMFKTPYHKNSSAVRQDFISSSEPGIVIGYEPRTPSNLRVFFPLTHTVGTRKPGTPVTMPTLIDALNAMDSKEKATLARIAPVSDEMSSLIPYDDQFNVSIDHLQEQYRLDLELGPLPSTSLSPDSRPPYESAQELAPPGQITQSQPPSLLVDREIFEESDELPAIDFSHAASHPSYDADSTVEYESDLDSDADDTAAYRSDLVPDDADDNFDYRSDHDAEVVAPTPHASPKKRRPRSRSPSSSSSTPPASDAAVAVGHPTSGFHSPAPMDVASSPAPRASSRLALKPRRHVSDPYRAYIITAAQAWGGTLPSPVLDAHKNDPLQCDERQALALMIQETSNMSIAQAKRAIQASQVDHAVATELHNIVKRETWKLVKPSAMTPDERRKLIPSKLFLKLKLKANGAIAKLKARLVAGGHRQHPDTFTRTSSPTIDTSHIFLALSLAATYGWDLATLDVPSAYLNADLQDTVHMRLDKDVSKIFVEAYPQFKDLVDDKGCVIVKLLKALYGLKQAGAAWNDNITALLKRLGFAQSLVDKCWFYKGQGSKATIVLLHVDDLLILTADKATRSELEAALKSAYGDDCELHTGSVIEYLGMQIERLNPFTGFKVWQPGYTSRSTENYKPDGKSYTTPSTADFFDTFDDPDVEYPAEYAYEFQSHLATLLY